MKTTLHYLFDFDGTLVDSMPYWAKCMLTVLDRHHIAYGEDIISIITPLGIDGTVKYFQSIGLDLPHEKIIEEIYGLLTPCYLDLIPEKAGVRHCLEAMKRAGICLHVLTASPHAWLDPCLARLGLGELFDNVWSAEDFCLQKTNPDIYKKAAERIGATVEEITFLDDNINADRAAKKAGMPVIGVYDPSTEDDTEAMKALTDGYIRDFGELEQAVLS